MNIRRAAILVNIIACALLTTFGIYLETAATKQPAEGFYLLPASIVLAFLSVIFWSHVYSKKSARAREARDFAIKLFFIMLVFAAVAVTSTLYALK